MKYTWITDIARCPSCGATFDTDIEENSKGRRRHVMLTKENMVEFLMKHQELTKHEPLAKSIIEDQVDSVFRELEQS